MAALFRCPECNYPLHHRHGDKPTKGCVLKCPECGGRLVVPAALASFPQPQIDTPIPATADDGPETPAVRPVVLPAMARSMPWLMSMCFHVALAMIFMFVAMIAAVPPPDIVSPMPNISDQDNSVSVSDSKSTFRRNSKSRKSRHRGLYGESTRMRNVLLKDKVMDDVIGVAASLGLEIDKNPERIIGSPEDGENIFDDWPPPPPRGRLPDVVFLIDRSGSMVDTFDTVRREMLLSIAGLAPSRKFHVVLFADGRPVEKPPRGMTWATDAAKVRLVKFLEPARASGQTDPIPAINRAFDALAKGSAGKVAIIHLLTDGVFPDNDAVLKTIRRRNAGGRVQINTILYGNRPPIAEEVMARIAAENYGKYRFISRDE
jgi:hypothetical protein